MSRRLFFYLRYALRNIRRGGRWTTLAIFCIAAGVAAVVALRGLGLSIRDSLLENVRIANKGDVTLTRGSFSSFNFGLRNREGFSQGEIERLETWAKENDAHLSVYMTGGSLQVTAMDFSTIGRPQFISNLLIDPATYPPSHEILALDPPGVPLSQLFSGGNEVVISQNLAETQGIEVGDTVRVSTTETLFTVRGIVATDNEAGPSNLFAAFFGFAYFDLEAAQQVLEGNFLPNTASLALPEGATADDIFRAERQTRNLLNEGRVGSRTLPERLEENEQVSQIMGDFIVVMGLGAMLIGGVGIMNTMLVMVRRRTNEIAALKTFGLKGKQVALLFAAEALILGIVGSLSGAVLGILLGGIVNRYGETFLQQRLPWRIYPEALLYGLVLGVTVAVIFGVAPILTAVKVRPGIILRPNETHIPKLGVIQSVLLLIFVTISLGLIVGQIVSPTFALFQETRFADEAPSSYVLGVLGVGGTFLVFGILILLLWVLVWLVGKMPSFGSVDLRLALRNLSTNRLRMATTLLALSAGMFALSSIAFAGQGARELLNVQLVDQFGGNVMVFPLPFVSPDLVEQALEAKTAGLEGISHMTRIGNYEADLLLIDGAEFETGFTGRRRDARSTEALAEASWSNILMRDTTYSGASNLVMESGRALTAEDYGKPYLIGPADTAAQLGIRVGSVLTYRINGQRIDFEVVGLIGGGGFGFNFSPVTIPGGVLTTNSTFQLFTFLVEPEHLNKVLVELTTIPLVIPLDVTAIDQLLSRIIDQFSALPTIVGLLSLLAAAVIMANTVALATLERRRQIGILKSLGLKGRRVLRVMLIETTLIGLLSAVIGLGLSSIGVSLMTSLGGLVIPLPADARLTAVALLLAAILIGWTATFLSARVAVGERVMNVLRYE